MIPITFISHASDLLGDTNTGLTGPKIAELTSEYAVQYNVNIPFGEYPFDSPNKRTALKENLKAFSSDQQFIILKDLCELEHFKSNSDVRDLKIKLLSRYGNLGQEINEILIHEVRHWLSDYPESLKVYTEALKKFDNQIFERNILDDLRLSLELLLKGILKNNKPLEKQTSDIGAYIREKGVSKELINMFIKLVDYYCQYQNTYVKHNDAVVENEIEIIFEMTSSFMKFISRIK
ncbi:hypothetical protein [Elizabethkingia anophelis]|uniref:hypothetical protein n=1 Tax=Elizabethkingia anophelis TaxID=1117645 RepID=UPI003892A470